MSGCREETDRQTNDALIDLLQKVTELKNTIHDLRVEVSVLRADNDMLRDQRDHTPEMPEGLLKSIDVLLARIDRIKHRSTS